MMRPRSVGLLLLLLTLLIFLRTTSNQFINFDDPGYVVENPVVNQGLSWHGIKWAFGAAHAANWHPLTWLSHMVDCDLFRLSPAGPHLINCLFHAVNTALLFALILRLTNLPRQGIQTDRQPENLWVAALVAALFGWHPLHVESVAWVAERKDVLSTFFSLLTLYAYCGYVRSRLEAGQPAANGATHDTRLGYVLTIICFALALLSKPMPVPLPLVMVLLDFWPLNRWPTGPEKWRAFGRLVLEKAPFFVMSAIVCLITIRAQHHAESSLANVSLVSRLDNVVTAYVGYLLKMIFPHDLIILYPFTPDIPRRLIVESGLILIGFSILAWRLRRSHPYLLVGWLWYLVTLLPVIGLIQVGSQAMADRYTYFPLIGIFLAAGFSLQAMAGRFKFLTSWLAAGSVAVLIACVALTERQLGYWHDSKTLFEHAIEVHDSEPARLSLGAAFQDENDLNEAMTQFMVAWREHPDSVLANFDVAGVLVTRGKFDLAAAFYERAAHQNNWNALVFENYGRDLVTLKRYPEAGVAFSRAIEIDPESAGPHFLMARLCLQEGRDQEAIKEFNKAMELDPQNLEMILLTANVLASSDDPKIRNGAKAKELAQSAVAMTRDQEAAPLDALAMSNAELGRYADAILIEQQAIKLASAAGQAEGMDLLEKHLETYQKNQPWRESFKAD